MTPVKARHERFGQSFVQIDNATGFASTGAIQASTLAGFVYFCFGKNAIYFNAI